MDSRTASEPGERSGVGGGSRHPSSDIAASEVVSDTVGGGGASTSQGQFSGKDRGRGTAFCRAGIPYHRGLGAGQPGCLGKTSRSPSDAPRQSGYDIYRVSSRQSMEDRGYVYPRTKSHQPETPTAPRAPSHMVVDGTTTGPVGCLGN